MAFTWSFPHSCLLLFHNYKTIFGFTLSYVNKNKLVKFYTNYYIILGHWLPPERYISFLPNKTNLSLFPI